jgi:hypothetical protein
LSISVSAKRLFNDNPIQPMDGTMSSHSIVQLRGLRKWAAYGLILLAPGSFVVLPTLWLVWRLAQLRREAAARAAVPGDAPRRVAGHGAQVLRAGRGCA